jgi:endonuclease/exonuclease/phosphatase family metal-dependent hydrolase
MVKKLLDTIKKIKCKKFNQTKFDIVYTYVDSTDKEWQKSIKKYFPNKNIDPQRYKDYGEIYFSLKTLEIFAKNICNNIYIVTDNQKIDETKISPWLKKNIKYVYHNEIIPPHFLPTFNSITIESFLHNIPNLTENFIYLNDDMFWGNFVTSDFFYNKNKCFNIFIRPIKKASNRSNNKPWLDYYLNVYNIFIDKFDIFPNFAPVHTYYMMNKELCKHVWKTFNEELNNSLTRIRNKININFWFLCYAMGLYKGYFQNKMPTLKDSVNITCHPGLSEDERIRDISIILNNRPVVFCYNNINKECEKYWEILKNNYLKDIITNFNVVTFNILAHKYTNFTRGHKTEKETQEEMKLRYVNLSNILKNINADIYCLQEVDELAAKFLSIVFKKKNYNANYVYQDKNNGLLILWKDKYTLKNKFKITITKKYYESNKSYPYKSQIAQFLILNINGHNLTIVNTRLWGHPDRLDVRKDELKNILKNIRTNNKTIICGDFNETDYKQIESVVGNRLNLFDKYFDEKNFATSYHPWNLNRETNEMYKEPPHHKYKSVDYFLYSKDLTVTKLIVKPNKNGVYGIEEPYKNTNTKYTLKKWPSDHALLVFTISV